MFVFVDDKYMKECRRKYNKKRMKHLAISYELLGGNYDGFIDASWVLPPPNIQNDYINSGDLNTYVEQYYEYLNSPMMLFNISFEIIASDGMVNDVAFLYYTDSEKELLYPSLFRRFLIDNLDIPKKFMCKYSKFDGKFKKIDEDTSKKIWLIFEENKGKAKELAEVIN
jgi:hypothetical protein